MVCLLWIFLLHVYLYLSLPYCDVCFLQPCWESADLLVFLYVFFFLLVFVTFLFGVLGTHARIQEISSGGGGGGGGPGQSDQKSSDKTLFFFLVLSLFYRSQMVNFKEIYHFSRFQRGSNIFQGGGVQLFPGGGGSNYLFPIETHISCDFPGGGSGPLSPLWIRTCRCGT